MQKDTVSRAAPTLGRGGLLTAAATLPIAAPLFGCRGRPALPHHIYCGHDPVYC